jgi:hypothetical protein
MNSIVEYLTREHPGLVKASRDLIFYDIKVQDFINKNYGLNTIENIQKGNEYNNDFEKIQNNVAGTSSMKKHAEKRKRLFDAYTSESYKLAKKEGFRKAMAYMDVLDSHLKHTANTIIS